MKNLVFDENNNLKFILDGTVEENPVYIIQDSYTIKEVDDDFDSEFKIITLVDGEINIEEEDLLALWEEQKLPMLRHERDKRLVESDWTQGADVPDSIKTAWQPYRQALRDITNTYTSLDDVIWPDKPE